MNALGKASFLVGFAIMVRHPMYAGACLWVVRISIEERFLLRELAGYEPRKVRHRLIPWVW